MILPKTNIQQELNKLRPEEFDLNTWKTQVGRVLNDPKKNEESVIKRLKRKSDVTSNAFDFDLLDADKIYHIDQIKKICIDYRLRFLDTVYFKGIFPQKALKAIEKTEHIHNTKLSGFKIIAPSKLFKLENADDPLLFAPISNGYYYLIDKWGNDLHPLRKWLVLPFKNLLNLILLILFLSWIGTELLPIQIFTKEPSVSAYMMLFFFIFKAIAAIAIFYGFALGKNFNYAIWNSKYFNA